MIQRTNNNWNELTVGQKIRQVWDYYKLPIFIAFVILYMIGYGVYRHVTVKDEIFYTACINVAPGEDLTAKLHTDFESAIVTNPKKEEMRFYTGLYLTTNTKSDTFQYAYSSQMKILASIDAEQLDVVLFDKEAYDAFSQNGYLYDLEELVEEYPELKECTDGILTKNLVILESNAKEVVLDSSVEFASETEDLVNGIDMSHHGILAEANLSGTVYLGVLLNTPRKDACARYIQYLLTGTLS